MCPVEVEQRLKTNGGVLVTSQIVSSPSAETPTAVFSLPVKLALSARMPMAVLLLPAVLKKVH